MKVKCTKCLNEVTPKKADKNIFSFDAKCSNCGAELDLSDSKVMTNVGRVFRIPSYIIMAYVILYVYNHMPTNFESFLFTIGYIAVIVAVVYALYCMVGNIVLFASKK